jgi:hypothetical protein
MLNVASMAEVVEVREGTIYINFLLLLCLKGDSFLWVVVTGCEIAIYVCLLYLELLCSLRSFSGSLPFDSGYCMSYYSFFEVVGAIWMASGTCARRLFWWMSTSPRGHVQWTDAFPYASFR